MEQLRSIVNVMKASGCEVPDWMLQMKPLSKSKRRQRATKPLSRKPISKVRKAHSQPQEEGAGQAKDVDGSEGVEKKRSRALRTGLANAKKGKDPKAKRVKSVGVIAPVKVKAVNSTKKANIKPAKRSS